MSTYEIPLTNDPQTMSVMLGDTDYGLTLLWGTETNCWLLHIDNADGVRILSNIPLVCGTDLLDPFAYLKFGGSLYASTDGDTFAVPTFSNLGTLGRVYFATS